MGAVPLLIDLVMIILYNMLQLLLLVVFFPFIAIFVLCSPKYRGRVPSRLGLGLKKKLSHTGNPGAEQKTFWIHALSVGETTSAEPLIRGLKKQFPESRIVFSVTTKTGRQVADSRLTNLVDVILDGPLDILPVVHYFQKLIQPDFYILVETDFWPNNLLLLRQKQVPTMLVNGRVSDKSIQGYRRMEFFFGPMFRSLSALCMQTANDKSKIESLGIDKSKVLTLGNLKFDTAELNLLNNNGTIKKHLPKNRTVFIAGSTHPGEEKILISSYLEVKKELPELYLIIAPRNVKRGAEIKEMASKEGLLATMRTEPVNEASDLFILNTIGELATCYSFCQIAFVGGSLVAKGGHNPIEPAATGIPVLFGPHMDDFSEIAESIVACGGGKIVTTIKELSTTLRRFLTDKVEREKGGNAAQNFVRKHRGVIAKHIDLIHTLH